MNNWHWKIAEGIFGTVKLLKEYLALENCRRNIWHWKIAKGIFGTGKC